MSLQPGTRLPMMSAAKAIDIGTQAYYRGLVEGLTLGAIAGGMAALCALALAWAHMGG